MARTAQRCRRLRYINTDIHQKAKLFQTAIWPYDFFGAETQVIGERHFQHLRGFSGTESNI